MKKLTPKQKKTAAIVACCICLVVTAVIAWTLINKSDIFNPIKHVAEELDEEQWLAVEDDDTGKYYGAPTMVDDIVEKILNGGSK